MIHGKTGFIIIAVNAEFIGRRESLSARNDNALLIKITARRIVRQHRVRWRFVEWIRATLPTPPSKKVAVERNVIRPFGERQRTGRIIRKRRCSIRDMQNKSHDRIL